MPRILRVSVACVFLLILLLQGVAAYTIGLPTEALDGLRSPAITQFEETVLTLFEGYSGMNIKVVRDSPESLWQMLREGSLDAIIARPDSSYIAVTSRRGKPLAVAKLTLPIKGSVACVSDTEENRRLLQPFGLQPSESEVCAGRTELQVSLVPAYPLATSDQTLPEAFEKFSTLHAGSIGLAAKSVGFDTIKRSFWENYAADPYKVAGVLFLMLITGYALFLAYRERKNLRNHLRTMHLQQQEVDHLIDQLMQLREQLDKLTEEHEALLEEKQSWERTQKVTESYVNGFIEMLKVIQLFGRSSSERTIIEGVWRSIKPMLGAEELAIYKYDNRSRKLYLQAGDDTTLPRDLNAGDPLVHSAVYLKGFDQKLIDGRNVFMCSIGPIGKAVGLMIAVEPKVLNARQLIQSLANLLYFMVTYQETSMKTFAYKKYANFLAKIQEAQSEAEVRQILQSADFEFTEPRTLEYGSYEAAHHIELQSLGLYLIVPDDWPWEFDSILAGLMEGKFGL